MRCFWMIHKVNTDIMRKKGFGAKFFRAFNAAFSTMTRKYIYSLKFLIKNKWIAVTGLALITGISVFLINKAPSGFIPTEDQGFVLYAVILLRKFIRKNSPGYRGNR